MLITLMITTCATITFGQDNPASGEAVAARIDFVKEDLIKVLHFLSAMAGYDLVIAPDVSGEVTVSLTDISYKEALKIVVQSQGYVYEQESKIVYVQKPGQKATDQENIVFFKVHYGDPKALSELMARTLRAEGQIFCDERGRMIVVKGSKTLVQQVRTMLETLDKKMPQITVEVKVIAVSTTALRKIGMEVLKDEKNMLNWGETSSGVQIVLEMVKSGKNWNAIFKSMISNGQARLISAPSVSTMNGQESSIIIADQIPIETSDEDGNINVSYVDVGIKLLFTPVVQRGDELFIDLNTQVSSLGDKMGSSYKIINKEVKSRIQAKIGETVFLGGLISQEEQVNTSKVPLLGDIPIIRKIFSTEYKQRLDNELIVMLTPRWTDMVENPNIEPIDIQR